MISGVEIGVELGGQTHDYYWTGVVLKGNHTDIDFQDKGGTSMTVRFETRMPVATQCCGFKFPRSIFP